MGRLHFVRHESSRHFVLSLSTTFKNVNALIDAVLNGLVVGYLEMQARYKLQSTPIPTVSCLSGPRMIYKEQRCCDCLLISVSHNQMKIFWHGLGQHLKKMTHSNKVMSDVHCRYWHNSGKKMARQPIKFNL
jgi:hypothetical protein